MNLHAFRWWLILLLAALVTGCINLPKPMANSNVRKIAEISSQEQLQTIEVGKSNKQDVLLKLGVTRSVSFESGYEVWAYQIKQNIPVKTTWVQRIEKMGSDKGVLGNLEVVLLFDPSGILSKKRVRDPSIEAQ